MAMLAPVNATRSATLKIVLWCVPIILTAGLLAGGPSLALAGAQFDEQGNVWANPVEPGARFGRSVDISGGTMVVGAPYEDAGGISDSGAVYVYMRTGERWTQTAKLTSPDPNVGDNFGTSVATDGTRIVVGALNDDEADVDVGAAYVFFGASTWSLESKLMPSDPYGEDGFGADVDVSGTQVVVGSPYRPDGSVYVFQSSGSQQTKITSGVAWDQFGYSLDLDGSGLAVGAPYDPHNGAGTGAAYYYEGGGASWAQRARLTYDSYAGDRFGHSVAVDVGSGVIVVGAPNNDDLRPNAGAAYIFTGSGSTWSAAAYKYSPYSANDGDQFGWSVAADAGLIVIGAPYADTTTWTDGGAAWVFEGGGATWTPYPPCVDTGAGASERALGSSVAISGRTYAAGVPDDDEQWVSDTDDGSAFVWALPAGSDPLVYEDNSVTVEFGSITTPGRYVQGGLDVFEATPHFEPASPAPDGYVLTDRTIFDVSTNAVFPGSFTITIPYNDDVVPNPYNEAYPVDEADLKLLHYDGEAWIDITTSVDTANNTVSGVASSFSEFAIAEEGTATTSPYSGWDPAVNVGVLATPHKDYSTSTNKCSVCHAVHNASPAGELLLPTTVANACVYCHINTSVGGVVVYGGDVNNYLNEDDYGHQAAGGAVCVDCHSVHGANTIGGDQGLETMILRAGDYQAEFVDLIAQGDADALTTGGDAGSQLWGQADWSDSEKWSEWDAQMTGFCTRCHQYFSYTSTETVAATGGRNHPMRRWYEPGETGAPDILGDGIKVADSSTRGCAFWCHYAPTSGSIIGVNEQSFPHHNPGYDKFLIAAEHRDAPDYPAPDSLGDDVCFFCHLWTGGSSEMSGVGSTY